MTEGNEIALEDPVGALEAPPSVVQAVSAPVRRTKSAGSAKVDFRVMELVSRSRFRIAGAYQSFAR